MRYIYVVLILFCLGKIYAQDSLSKKSVQAFPVPAIGKSIETDWYFGAVCLFKFKNFFNTPQYSTAKLKLEYSLNKQFVVTTNWFIYTNQNKKIIIGDNAYLYFPEYYFGIGNNTAENNKLYYTAQRLELYNSLLWKIKPSVYLGVSVKAQSISELEPEYTNTAISHELVNNNAGWSTGVGPHLLRDKRDRILNPSAGSSFIEVENINYIKEKTTQNTNLFSSLKADIRYYHKLFAKSVIAWQYYSVHNFGNAPYRLLGLLGSDSHMRGYYQGRYRDNHYIAVQAEARIRIRDWLGFTLFTGVGDVYNNFSDANISNIKYTNGGGIRIRVDKDDNVNLRFDYGIGKETAGFYVAFGEAF
ncbi:MAG: BamA/TamA family outer membrane protein [Bacteroidota bacterium]